MRDVEDASIKAKRASAALALAELGSKWVLQHSLWVALWNSWEFQQIYGSRWSLFEVFEESLITGQPLGIG